MNLNFFNNLPLTIARFTAFYFVYHLMSKYFGTFLHGYPLTFISMFLATFTLHLLSAGQIKGDNIFSKKFWVKTCNRLINIAAMSVIMCFLIHLYSKVPF